MRLKRVRVVQRAYYNDRIIEAGARIKVPYDLRALWFVDDEPVPVPVPSPAPVPEPVREPSLLERASSFFARLTMGPTDER